MAQANIFSKLLEVKKRVPYLEKDKKKGNGLQYSYATPSQVLGVINPILNELGLFLKTEVLNVTYERVFQKKKGIDVWINKQNQPQIIDVYETMFNLSLKFTWIDTTTGEKDESLFFSSGVNGDEKGLGSALTYAERYFILKTFNIPTDDDDPDSFQEKTLTKEEKEKLKEEKEKQQQQEAIKKEKQQLQKAITEMGNTKSLDELKNIWSNYKQYQTNELFVKAKDDAKQRFSTVA